MRALKWWIPGILAVGCGGEAGCPEGQVEGDDGECRLSGVYVGDDDDDDDTFDPDDTDDPVHEGPPVIDIVALPDCFLDDWTFGIETLGVTGGENLVNSWDQGADVGQRWHEEHDLPTVSADPNGQWDVLALEVEATGAYVRNVSSAFDCDVHGAPGAMVYAFRVYDADGNYADCAILSHAQTQGLEQVLAGDTDSFNPPTRPDEINAVDCESWD